MAVRAVDSIRSDSEALGFELERLKRVGDRGLEVRGRWFGIRGRRFVRPTLTMRVDGAKHRLLADLEHKPWAAEEGEEWVALFSPMPPPGKADRVELSVAPDITVALSPVGSGRSSAKAKRPANGAGTPARRPPRRASQPDVESPALERERANARELGSRLENSGAELARLAAERDDLLAQRDELRVERDALLVERDGMRRQHTRARKRVTELQRELKGLDAGANAGLAEARDLLEVERAATASQPRAARSEAASVRRALPPRSPRRAPVWVVRALALIALVTVPVVFALVLHLV